MIKFKRIKYKLTERFKEFALHPITKKSPISAFYKYIAFNTFGLLKKERIFTWINPLKFYARIGDASMAGNVYFGLGELNESLFTLFLLREEDQFIDIGANLGHYSLLASGITKAHSIAVEPVPSTFKQLKRQIELNGLEELIKPLNIGLGDKEEKLLFTNDKGTMNRVLLVPETGNAVSVPVKRLDDIKGDKKPVLIKIDVEGFEKFVLDGAKLTLKDESLKAMIVELNGSGEIFNIKDEDVFQIMKSNGFSPYSFSPYGRELQLLETYNKQQYNTIFIKDLSFCEQRIKTAPEINIQRAKF